jgi:hypothetical protein
MSQKEPERVIRSLPKSLRRPRRTCAGLAGTPPAALGRMGDIPSGSISIIKYANKQVESDSLRQKVQRKNYADVTRVYVIFLVSGFAVDTFRHAKPSSE